MQVKNEDDCYENKCKTLHREVRLCLPSPVEVSNADIVA